MPRDTNFRPAPVKALVEQFDLGAFRAFVASKPADEKYNSWAIETCALGQFGFRVAGSSLSKFGVPEEVYDAAAHTAPYTFGALSDRLKAAV